SGGSMTTASVTPAVKAAAEDALLKLKTLAGDHADSPLRSVPPGEIIAEDGLLRAKRVGGDPNRSISYGELLRTCKTEMIQSDANVAPGAEMQKYAIHSFGAQFSEVRVDADTGEVRVTRHVAVFDIGRVINLKTARSQALGGITQ